MVLSSLSSVEDGNGQFCKNIPQPTTTHGAPTRYRLTSVKAGFKILWVHEKKTWKPDIFSATFTYRTRAKSNAMVKVTLPYTCRLILVVFGVRGVRVHFLKFTFFSCPLSDYHSMLCRARYCHCKSSAKAHGTQSTLGARQFLPEKINKNARILHDVCPKNTVSRAWGRIRVNASLAIPASVSHVRLLKNEHK